MTDPEITYDNGFYDSQILGSAQSATRYAELLTQVFRPKTILDVGCGRGTWLHAFLEHGATEAVGIDGQWNKQSDMVDPRIRFIQQDLNEPSSFPVNQIFDLAMSLEVAEHLRPSASDPFVAMLTNQSDVVMFGAAYLGQGGNDHTNERTHSYWGDLFRLRSFVAYDLFRPKLWAESGVEYWYAQNTFLFVKTGSAVASLLEQSGHRPMPSTAFMDCIHPRLYHRTYTEANQTIVDRLRRRIPWLRTN